MLTRDPGMQKLCRQIEKLAPTQATVLLLGDSGTGKEVLARALHQGSPRRDKRFVAINCAAIPDTLLESELFGYEKGAFTGAAKTTPGKIRDRRRRHAVPGRDRRPAAGPAGETASLPAGARDRTDRRARGDSGRRPNRLCDPSQPARTDQGRRVSRGPVLPAERNDRDDPPAARTRRRRHAARPRIRAALRAGQRPRPAGVARGRTGCDRAPPLARQRARTGELHQARGDHGRRPHHHGDRPRARRAGGSARCSTSDRFATTRKGKPCSR